MFKVSMFRAGSSVRSMAFARSIVTVGSPIPTTELFDGSPGNSVNLANDIGSGKSVIIGVPGAFSPGCTATHIPGYLDHLKQFNDKGYNKLYVVTVNDAFVTKAWSDSMLQKVGGDQVKFLADPAGKFTNDLDLLFDAKKFFGNDRSRRYALLVDNGKVTKTFIEPDNTSVNLSAADKVLAEA